MGFVVASNEAPLVGTMTSAGTAVIEMSANTPGSTTDVMGAGMVGDCELVLGGNVESGVVAMMVGASVGATDVAADTGVPNDVGDVTGLGPASHEAITNAMTTRLPTLCTNGCDLISDSGRSLQLGEHAKDNIRTAIASSRGSECLEGVSVRNVDGAIEGHTAGDEFVDPSGDEWIAERFCRRSE